MPDPTPPLAEERFPLLAGTRRLVPIAFVLAVAGAVLATNNGTRLVYLGLTLLVVALAFLVRARRPVLVIDDAGYRVEIRRRVRVRVRWDEVKHARGADAEHAMYLDCGEPARNLLLPPGRGYGFRFERQDVLYARLALRLADRLELVDSLVPDPPVKNGHNKPSPPQ